MLTVYTRPGCGPCKATVRHLTRAGIPHTTVDVSTDKIAAAAIKGLGYEAAPVIVFDEYTHWSGYRPDMLDVYKPRGLAD